MLIDGDGYIFDERLIQQGTTGGEIAAHHVHKNIQHYFHPRKTSGGSDQRFDGASNWRIVVKIYMNLDGLAKTLYRAGLITNSKLMQDFAIGFNQCQPLFEIVDVGRGYVNLLSSQSSYFHDQFPTAASISHGSSKSVGYRRSDISLYRKERTDYKFKANFELFVPNTHCKHLVLGCAHDHGYIPMLDQYKNDKRARGRITLLQTEDVAQGYLQLPFSTTCFVEGLLKSSATLNTPNNSGKMSPSQRITRQPTPPTSPNDLKTTKAQLSGGLMSPQSPREEKRNETQQQGFIYPRPVTVNKKMERVDQELPPVSETDADALDRRLQNPRAKPCNVYNLVGICSIPGCRFDHASPLPAGERLAYARVQRTKSCRNGAKCRNESCIFGHMCPHEIKGHCIDGQRLSKPKIIEFFPTISPRVEHLRFGISSRRYGSFKIPPLCAFRL